MNKCYFLENEWLLFRNKWQLYTNNEELLTKKRLIALSRKESAPILLD